MKYALSLFDFIAFIVSLILILGDSASFSNIGILFSIGSLLMVFIALISFIGGILLWSENYKKFGYLISLFPLVIIYILSLSLVVYIGIAFLSGIGFWFIGFLALLLSVLSLLIKDAFNNAYNLFIRDLEVSGQTSRTDFLIASFLKLIINKYQKIYGFISRLVK